LTNAINIQQQRKLSSLEKQGFVKAFEFTHEQAWKVMKDFFIYQGYTHIIGSRDATREAFQNNLITQGEDWMEMIITRNKAVHTYDEVIVDDVINKTTRTYYPLYLKFASKMESLKNA
jgi:nucleotidyltransferase substrate binding protein (TIGR01987 family)